MLRNESPDMVILDLALVDGHGLDVLRNIRKISDVPVVIVSVKADEVSRVKGLEDGADDYIVKPFSHSELLARIRAGCAGRTCPSCGRTRGWSRPTA